MRLASLAVVVGLLFGCVGLNSRQADEINVRLATIESRLDCLASRSMATPASPDFITYRDSNKNTTMLLLPEAAVVIANIDRLKSQGFTDSYLPLKQQLDELKRISERTAEVIKKYSVTPGGK